MESLVQKYPHKSYTIYDLGCGDGHMLRKIAELFDNKGVDVKLVGIDIREDVLAIAREKSKSFPTIKYEKGDILTFDNAQKCDILLCTLTMHHFSKKEMERFLKKFSELARIGVNYK